MKTRLLRFLRPMGLAALAAATVVGPAAPPGRSQEKSTPVSKVERLNRAPVNKEALRVQLPRPTVVKLPNGLTLVLLEDHKLPTVAFAMWIRPGQLADPSDFPGLAAFTTDMLREGTERRTSLQIAAEVDSLGATLTANSRFGMSYTAINASGLADNATQVLDLLSDIVLHPVFSPSELAKYKQRERANIEERLSNPGFLAQQTFRRALYGDGPLSVVSPTKESIEKVTSADLKRFHDQHFRPGNSIVGATGDFKTGEIRALIEKYFGQWVGAAEPPLVLSSKNVPSPAGITLASNLAGFFSKPLQQEISTYGNAAIQLSTATNELAMVRSV